MNIGISNYAQRSANRITSWITSLRSLVVHIGTRGRGLIMLLVLLLVGIPPIAQLSPRSVTPASAPLDVFSAERAMVHLPIIAKEPHPVGSPAQARVRDYLVQQLTEIGLEVEVQKTVGLENVVARLHGSNPTGAIVILTHHDTVSSTPGAADNGSTVAALLEITRALAAGPTLRNDVIVLFHDKEEIGPFSGTRAFVREHPWMSDVRLAISIDSAVASFISVNEVGPMKNGWLVQVLDLAYTGGFWMSMSGGGNYNSTPFREEGIPVLALEDNYPFRQKHTAEDLPEIIRPGSVQQMGEQTVSIARVLGDLDLANPWGEQETFFSLPLIGFIHYPEAWSPALAIITSSLLLLALGLTLWRRFVSWRGLGVAFGTILVTAMLAVLGVGKLQPRLPAFFDWKTYLWQEWPEVIPPNGWLAAAILGILVFGLTLGAYVLARRWSAREDFSLMGLVPFTIAAVALAFAEPRAAYTFIWPVLIGALIWIATAAIWRKPMNWSRDVILILAILPLSIFIIPFLPGIIMADGMKSLNILAGVEVALLSVILPAIDGLVLPQRTPK